MEAERRIVADRYELKELLGSGGMADVYRAADQRLNRDVAVKLLLPAFAGDAEFVERFRREARSAAALNHPNVVAVYDWGSDAGSYFMVMEYVPGPTLKDTIRTRGPLAEDETLEIMEQATAGLQAAHDYGLVHRDVKPHNILLAPNGRVKVADFGIAYATGSTQLTTTNAVSGTAMYMSPEQAQQQRVDSRSDVYSLGIVFYEMLTGVAPYREGSVVNIAMQHVNAPMPNVRAARPGLHPETVAILERALSKLPSSRYRDAGEMHAALMVARDQRNAVAAQPARLPKPIPPAERTLVRPVGVAVPLAARQAPEQSRGLRGIVLAVPFLIAGAVAGVAVMLHHPSPSTASNKALGSSTATPVPTSAVAKRVHHHVVPPPRVVVVRPTAAIRQTPRATSAAHKATPTAVATVAIPTPKVVTPPRRATATAVPAHPAVTAAPTAVAGGLAINTGQDPAQTVQSFYGNIAQHNFAAAAALWTSTMVQRCDPAACINGRFAATSSTSVHVRVTAPPQNGQSTVAVDLVEFANNQQRHYVGYWNLVQQGGRWLMNGESFCQLGVDTGCSNT